MTKITIFISKYRIAKCNRLKWKSNHHKKPFYLLSELNKAIRYDKELKLFFMKNYKSFYRFKRSWDKWI